MGSECGGGEEGDDASCVLFSMITLSLLIAYGALAVYVYVKLSKDAKHSQLLQDRHTIEGLLRFEGYASQEEVEVDIQELRERIEDKNMTGRRKVSADAEVDKLEFLLEKCKGMMVRDQVRAEKERELSVDIQDIALENIAMGRVDLGNLA